MASTSLTPSTGWKCTFHLGDKVLPTDSSIQTWRSGLGGQVSDSLKQALLLPANLDHYAVYRDEDIILKLKWYTIAMSIPSLNRYCFHYYLFLYFSISNFL